MFGSKKEKEDKQFVSYKKYLIDLKSQQLKQIQKIKLKPIAQHNIQESPTKTSKSIKQRSRQTKQKLKQKKRQKQKQRPTECKQGKLLIKNQMDILTQVEMSKSKESQKQKEKENWQKIDQKATIVNGKLVYIQSQRLQLNETSELVNILKDNNIRIKDFIFGDKSRILCDIKSNYEKKKNEEVEKYITKNMIADNNLQVNCSDWYEQAKNNLFGNRNQM